MKTLNNIFVGAYSIVLIASVWLGINWMVTRGIASMFDDSLELSFAVLYVAALLFSIYIHVKLKDKSSTAIKICAVVTSINAISFVALALSYFNSNTDDGLFLTAWMLGVLAFWLISLISGTIALNDDTIQAS